MVLSMRDATSLMAVVSGITLQVQSTLGAGGPFQSSNATWTGWPLVGGNVTSRFPVRSHYLVWTNGGGLRGS
jgi:hypothetical protein